MKGLIFDKDGTLFDFQATWSVWADRVLESFGADARHDAAAALGYDREARRFRAESVVIAGTTEDVVRALAPVAGGEKALAASLDRIAENTPQAPVPGVGAALARLARNRVLGLVTNDGARAAETHLTAAGIAQHFSFVAGYDSGFGAKPEAGQITAFLRAAGLSPSEAAMVGDSRHDLLAARAAGVTAVAVLTGVATEADLSPLADAVLPDVTRLEDWLEGR